MLVFKCRMLTPPVQVSETTLSPRMNTEDITCVSLMAATVLLYSLLLCGSN